MKNLFAVAILTATFAFTSCGNKPADTTAATTATTPAATNTTPALTTTPAIEDSSLSGRAAKLMCSCDAMKEMISLSKEMEANPNKITELRPKLMELRLKLEDCGGDIKTEVKQLSPDDLKKYQAELVEKIEKSCPEHNIWKNRK